MSIPVEILKRREEFQVLHFVEEPYGKNIVAGCGRDMHGGSWPELISDNMAFVVEWPNPCKKCLENIRMKVVAA